MTLIATVNHADSTDELTQLADGVGVFVVQAPDVTGGLDELRSILGEKTSANPQVVESSTTVASSPRSIVRRLRACARRSIHAVRAALAWLREPIDSIVLIARQRRTSSDYAGRHRTQTAWYGVQRSTAQRVSVQRRRITGRAPIDSEPALPEYWISHITRCVEAIRGHEDVLHPKRGYQFIC